MRQICSQAESDLQMGRTEEARDTLLHHLNAFKGTLKRDALRMIALCCLTDYDEQKAGEYVKMMLEVDPYYSIMTNDPPIFVSIVNELKAGKTATVTTASSMEESLDEVPVPTTLITEEMIRNCGGRNLQEVLAAYVPGMNLIDCNDGINIAMRGIYSNMQEKILFLLNGHRLGPARFQHVTGEDPANRGAARSGIVGLWRRGTDGGGEHHHQAGSRRGRHPGEGRRR